MYFSVSVALLWAMLRSRQHSKGLPWQVYTGVRLRGWRMCIINSLGYRKCYPVGAYNPNNYVCMTCYAAFDSSPPDVVVHELTPEGEKDRVVPVLGLLPCAPLRLQDRHGDAPRTRQPALRWTEGARENKSIVSSCRCRYYYRMV